MRSRAEIKAHAWQSVKQNYWPVVGAYVLVMIITFVCSAIPGVSFALTLLIGNIVTVGLCGYFLWRFRWHQVQVGVVFWPFNRYGRVLGGTLWKTLWVFLWTLLFVVPGIVKSYSYFCTEYILADSPNVEATRALDLSKRMMNGNKGKVFVMHLSFIGWALIGVAIMLVFLIPASLAGNFAFSSHLQDINNMNPFAIFAFGSALTALGPLLFYAYLALFLGPYVAATSAGFYEEIKHDAIMRGVIAPQEFDFSEAELRMQYEQYYQGQQQYGQPPYGQQEPYGQQQPEGQPSNEQQPDGQQPPNGSQTPDE